MNKSKKSNISRFAVRPGREIVVNNVKWKWSCSAGGGVVAYCEDGNRAYDLAWKIKGVDLNDFWRGTSDGELTPKEVSKWLESIK